MTNYGPNKTEKKELGLYLLCISLGSFLSAVSLVAPDPWAILMILPGAGTLTIGVVMSYMWAEQLSLRIRIEESQEKSDLIEKIVAIYRGNG